MERKVTIQTAFITLGQLLKTTDVIATGGMAKSFLNTHQVFVNGQKESRRGRKLYPNDRIDIEGYGTFLVTR